jgi:Flp pilus assembly protein TadD
LRRFTEARDDLQRAADLDPKQTEAYYHLGLAHYFVGEFAPAAEAFCKGRDLVTAQDGLVNFTNWCYVALRRAGKKEEAAKALEKVPPDMQSNPGHTTFYFNLVRFYQGLKTEADILPPAPADTESELSSTPSHTRSVTGTSTMAMPPRPRNISRRYPRAVSG